MKRTIGSSLAIILVAVAFFSGVQFGQGYVGQSSPVFSLFAAGPAVAESDSPDLTEFWAVWNLLEEKFAVSSTSQNLTVEERIQGAIDGLVDTYGDPYTVYLPPEDTDSFTQDISGEFSGVGMEVGIRDRYVTIIAPLPETPAMNAGLLAGDIITAIDGETTEDLRLDQAVDRIRGPKGTDVVLTIFRAGEPEFFDVTVTRDTIAIPTVKTEQAGDVFIISLYSFNAISESKMRAALATFQTSSATKLIVDVRGNPGGFLESAVGISDLFLPAGKVIVQESFVDPNKDDTFRSRRGVAADFSPTNLVVLVDGGSASASEILAGALQDHGVATIIGATTFGKGSVQELVELADGSSLKVTIARWLTPNGTSISDGGLTPDILISRTPQQILADEDPQRAAALRFLAGEVVESETFTNDLLTTASSSASSTVAE